MEHRRYEMQLHNVGGDRGLRGKSSEWTKGARTLHANHVYSFRCRENDKLEKLLHERSGLCFLFLEVTEALSLFFRILAMQLQFV